MAQRTGLEPATPGVTGRYSNQLNYRCKVVLKFNIFIKKTSIMVGGNGLEPLTLCV